MLHFPPFTACLVGTVQGRSEREALEDPFRDLHGLYPPDASVLGLTDEPWYGPPLSLRQILAAFHLTLHSISYHFAGILKGGTNIVLMCR